MNSSLSSAKKIEFINQDGRVLSTNEFVNSSYLKNELLGMMNSLFGRNEVHIKDLTDKSIIDDEITNQIDDLLMYQESSGPRTTNQVFSSASSQKLAIIDCPAECVSVNIYLESGEVKHLDFIDEDNEEYITNVNKLLIIKSGSSTNKSVSLLIHESSKLPHSEISSKVLLIDEVIKVIYNNEVTDLYHNKSNTVLGDYIDPIE